MMRNEGWHPRQIREYFGKGQTERHFPRMDTTELVATLDRVGIGYPITFNNNPGAPLFRIGYVVPLGEGTNFVCMDNGVMQLRTGNKTLDARYPLTMLASVQTNQSFEQAQEARTFFLNARRSTEEVVLTNSKRRHKKSFYDALGKVKEKLEETYIGIQEQNNMLEAIMPQGEGLRERVELEEQLRDKQTRVIDSLAQEKFGKALVETIEGTDIIGYALPVPFERDGRIDEDTRQLILLKE